MEEQEKTKIQQVIIIHGGAGSPPPGSDSTKVSEAKNAGMKKAVTIGYKILKETGDSMSAVEAAVRSMEDDPAFNCGYGSVLTSKGEVEQDAVVIRGSDLSCGSVGAVKNVKHAVSLARCVMEKSKHCLLVGQGAIDFAKLHDIELVDNEQLVSPRSRAILQEVLSRQMAPTTELGDEKGTVGAVAINLKGEIAAATSTGGLTDTPIIGAGTFADDEVCGISATGRGEAIMRTCLSSRIANLIQSGTNASESCRIAVDFMSRRIPNADAGAIVIDRNGQVGFACNCRIMSWAYITEANDAEIHCGFFKDEHIITPINI